MASSITPRVPHNVAFANPNKLRCSSSARSPPLAAFPSQSPSRASDSMLCLCHGRSSESPSPSERSPPWRLDTAIQNFVRSAVESFDSYVKSQKKGMESMEEAKMGYSGDEWNWDRWKKHFEDVDEQERLISVLKLQLDRSVQMEDYEEAGRLKVAIAAAAINDTVGKTTAFLNRAIAEERYKDAALIRDTAGAGLLGWWGGVSDDRDDPYGIIIRITAEHGRYVARSYSPRQLATSAVGVPLFEVFIRVDEKGKYKQQVVYLKHRQGQQDTPKGSFKAFSDASMISPLDSFDENSDILTSTSEEDLEEEEEETDVVEDSSDLPEEVSGLKNILRDMIPGVKVKVLKVTAPGKVDKDMVSKVIEQMMEEEDDENDLEVEEVGTDDDVRAESDEEKDLVGVDSDMGVLDSKGQSEFAVKVVVGGLMHRLSGNVSSKDLIRVPAKLEQKGHFSFSFFIDKEVNGSGSNGKKLPAINREGKFKGQRSIDHVMLDLAKFISGEKIPLKVLKDVGELINLTLNQAQNHRRLSGSTTFKRIEIPMSLDPLNGLYIGAHGIYTSEVIHLRRKFGQWKEENKENLPDLEFYEYVEALKLTGDRYVPAGEVAFRAKIGKRFQLPHRGIIPEELGVIARYRGQGRLAEPGFRNPRWVDGELVVLDGKYIRGGPVVGFVYWAPEYHFLVFFNRLRLED